MSHYDEEALFEYVEGTSPIAADIASHVSTCSRCSSEVFDQRAIMASLGDPEVWEAIPPAPRQFVVDVTTFAESARSEEEHAAAVCDEVLNGPAAWWPQRLRKTAAHGSHTAGLVKELLERWRRVVDTSPSNALQITAMAVGVANALDLSSYPCDYVIKLRAQACRDHSWMLWFVGRHPEALDFIDRSKRLFEQVPLPDYDLARVALVKASILSQVDRGDEALHLAREAADTFFRFGDRARWANARSTEAGLLYQRKAVQEAFAVWSSVQDEPSLDAASAVKIAHNIALCYIDLGQPERAIEYERRCIAHYEMLGMDVERTRSQWMIGRALAGCGRTTDAIPVFRAASEEFQAYGMVGDAGLVALELAEALLVVGEADEVPAICRDIITQFTHAGMASRAINALSFLREAIAIGQGTPSLVRHVHAFLRELPAEQPRLFAPPPPGVGE
jgi:tetratricopeptide (TPR) repeat protein